MNGGVRIAASTAPACSAENRAEVAYDFLIKGNYFEPTGKISKARLNRLLDALKGLGDIPQDFSVDRLFLPGVTQVSD